MSDPDTKHWKLCYVEDNFAFFTTQDLDKQWGDDWNDAPYEHNAGRPYSYRPGREGEAPYELLQVAFEADLLRPCDTALNSGCSVQQINAGHVAWLRTTRWHTTQLAIRAGVSIEEFTRLIEATGGHVFVPSTPSGN